MTQKTSLFKLFNNFNLLNKGLISSALKRFWWVSALYTVLLFFSLPLRLIMQLDLIHEEWVRRNIVRSLDITTSQSQVQVLLIFLVPVIIGVLVFRYLQQDNAASMMHSLPFTRKELFINQVVSGFLLLMFPIFLNGILLLFFQATTELGELYSVLSVFSWVGFSLLFILLMFSFSVFVGMFTGSSIAQLVFNYILHLFPLGFYVLLQANLTQILHGYSRSSLSEPLFLENIPFAALTATTDLNELIAWYLIFAVIFFIASYYSYKIRNIEVAGDVISFPVIQPIFKYGVTLCSMLLGGAYFTSISTGGFITVFFGYIFSSLLGYFIAEMLIQKSYKVLNAYKGYLVYIVVVSVVFAGIQADVIGFVGRVPEPQEVKSVYFGQSLYQFENIKQGDLEYSQHFYKESKNIENIINLHKELIKSGKTDSGRYQHIVYTLQDESYLVREYRIDEEEHASLLKPIYESLEYKKGRFPILGQSVADINRVELRDNRAPDEKTAFLNDDEIKEFVALLQQEVKDLTYEELIETNREYIYATINDVDGSSTLYNLRESYDSIFTWLEENNYYERVIVQPEDIEYIVLEKMPGIMQDQPQNQQPVRVEIRKPQVIEEVLSLIRYQGHLRKDVKYVIVGFYSEEQRPFFQGQLNIDENILISDELKSYLGQLEL